MRYRRATYLISRLKNFGQSLSLKNNYPRNFLLSYHSCKTGNYYSYTTTCGGGMSLWKTLTLKLTRNFKECVITQNHCKWPVYLS